MLCSVFFIVITGISIGSIVLDSMFIASITFVFGYYEIMRINRINHKMERAHQYIDDRQTHRLVKQFIEEHNRYCTHIWMINVFYKNIYLAFLVTNIPFNLLALYQVLYESLDINIKLIFICSLFCNDICLIGIQSVFALLSKKIHKMGSKLSRLQWSVNGYPFRMRLKMKLLMCLERLSAKQKIGFKVAGTACTMTFAIFSQV